jgi:hypothetical protein
MKDPQKQAKKVEGEEIKSSKDRRIRLFDEPGIRPVIDHVCKLEVEGESERHALEVICDRAFEITTYRVNRLELAQHGLSSGLYLLIPFMSLVIWIATLLLPIENVGVHGLIVFSTTVALFSLFLLLLDSDHPFIGLFSIDKEILGDITRKLPE